MKLACAGNALMDVIAFVDQDHPASLGLLPGSTSHVDQIAIERVLAPISGALRSAGGGAANTARVFSALGQESSFCGMIGNDAVGSRFGADLQSSGVGLYLQLADSPTGVFCVMIAPNGERTIAVAPGPASNLDAAAIPDRFFSSDATLYLDGFLAASPDTLLAIVSRARKAGMRVALDVAGFRVATKNRALFLSLIREACSWTFMNEDEFIALAEASVDGALKAFSADAPGIVVVKRAETGAVCVSDGTVLESAVRPIRATDTTGAGDAFAAGFLSAALSGEALARCLRLGNRVAEHAIQVPGMALDSQKLRQAISELL